MIPNARQLPASCALLLAALALEDVSLAQARVYVCKQADGSEIMTSAPTGDTCKLFTPGKGTVGQAPDRGKVRARGSADARRLAAEEAQRREVEAQNRKVQELLDAQRREAEDMRRRAEEKDAQRRAAEAQRQADVQRQQAAVVPPPPVSERDKPLVSANTAAFIGAMIGLAGMIATLRWGNKIENRYLRYSAAAIGLILAILLTSTVTGALSKDSDYANSRAGGYFFFLVMSAGLLKAMASPGSAMKKFGIGIFFLLFLGYSVVTLWGPSKYVYIIVKHPNTMSSLMIRKVPLLSTSCVQELESAASEAMAGCVDCSFSEKQCLSSLPKEFNGIFQNAQLSFPYVSLDIIDQTRYAVLGAGKDETDKFCAQMRSKYPRAVCVR